jgi:hypothetical protein
LRMLINWNVEKTELLETSHTFLSAPFQPSATIYFFKFKQVMGLFNGL